MCLFVMSIFNPPIFVVQLPTHQSQLVESPSGRWSLSSSWEAWLTYREAQTETSTARIGKARAAFVMLKNIWASGGISMRTKLRIFNSNVKSVLLYGCETWRTTQTMQQKIYRHSSTPVLGASTKSNGKRRSEMKICASERDRNQWPSRHCRGSGAGSDTPSGSQHPEAHAKP